jgi:hypothetical protein
MTDYFAGVGIGAATNDAFSKAMAAGTLRSDPKNPSRVVDTATGKFYDATTHVEIK